MAGVYDPGLEQIRTRRRIAEAIAGNAINPALQAGPTSLQYVGPAGSGQVVPYSPVSAVSKIAEAFIARKQMEQADLAEKQYNEQRKTHYDTWLKSMPQNGTPEEQLAWAMGGFNLPGGENVAPIMLNQFEKRQERTAAAAEKEKDRALKAAEQKQQSDQFYAKLTQDKAEAEAKLGLIAEQQKNANLTAGERLALDREKLAAETAWRNADRQQRGDISQAEIGSREKVAGAQLTQQGLQFAATLEQKRAEAVAQADHWARQANRADLDAKQRAEADAQRLAWDKERVRLETEAAAQRQQAQIGSTEKLAAANLAQQGAIAGGQLEQRRAELQATIKRSQAELAQRAQEGTLTREHQSQLQAQAQAAQRELEGMRQEGANTRQAAQLTQQGAQAGAELGLRERQLQAQIEHNQAQLQNAGLDRASHERMAADTAALQRELEGMRQTGANTRQAAQLTQQGAQAGAELGLRERQLQAQIDNNTAQLQRADLDRASREKLATDTAALQRELEGMRQTGANTRQAAQLTQQGAQAGAELGLRERQLQAQIDQNNAQLQNQALDRASRERLAQQTAALQRELEGIRQAGAGARQTQQIQSTEGMFGAKLTQEGAQADAALNQRRAELQATLDRTKWELDFRREQNLLTNEHQARLQAQAQAAAAELEQMRQTGANARQVAQIGAEDARAAATRAQQLQSEEARLVQQASQAGAQPPAGMSLLELAKQAGAAQGRVKAAEEQRQAEEKRREFDVRMAETQAAGRRAEATSAEQARHNREQEAHNREIAAIQRRNAAVNETKANTLQGGGKAQTPENAGKIASIRQGIKDVSDARAMVLKEGPNGVTFNRALATAAAAPFGGIGGDARKLKSAIYNASDIILRLRTGAAANASEVQKMADTFSPSPLDTAESAAYKFDRLQTMFKDALELTGYGDAIAPAPKVERKPAPGILPLPPGAPGQKAPQKAKADPLGIR